MYGSHNPARDNSKSSEFFDEYVPANLPIQINDLCPSSLTSSSDCSQSPAYKANCLAYCEQHLYWFLGPEVPYPNSNCAPNESCTFAGAKSLAITNSFTISGGLVGKFPSEALDFAFNAGATFTFSNTTTTTQILTEIRPPSANDS